MDVIAHEFTIKVLLCIYTLKEDFFLNIAILVTINKRILNDIVRQSLAQIIMRKKQR